MTTVFSSVTSVQDANVGYSIRSVETPSAGSDGQVRVSFKAGGSGNFVTTHCSIGVNTTPTSDTLATPVELKFGGASGFTLAANGTITSDWVDFNWTNGQSVVVITDVGSPGYGTDISDPTVGTAVAFYYKAATESWNVAVKGTGYSNVNSKVYGVVGIETQAGAAAPSPKRPPQNFFPLPFSIV
jgi:hypothetical protein